MSTAVADFDEKESLEREMFLRLVSHGLGPNLAGSHVGWTPAKTRRLLADPGFAELVQESRDSLYEAIELTLNRMALNGNMTAIQMVLYNRKSDEWRDVKRIEVRRTVDVNLSVVGNARELVRQIAADQGVKALQPGSVIDAAARDADHA